jgi:general secretion pathway protein K
MAAKWAHALWAVATRPIGSGPACRAAPRRRKVERGVALLVVLSTITLVGTVVAELQFNTRVDLQLALNSRDEVQAEYSALSALRLRAMLLKNGRLLDQGIRAMASSFGVDAGMIPPVGQLLEMVPVECSLMSAITHATGGGDRKGAGDDDSGMFPGDCSATSKSEHSKISLPALSTVRPGEAQQAQMMLLGFLSDPKMERFFTKDSEAGDHADTPQELVGSIIDWMDQDKVQAGSQVGDEDRFYAYLKDPYRTKNAPFDSVAELQLVHGMSDELYQVLKDRVTVYNTTAQIELATADEVTIAIGVCSVTLPGACAAMLSSPMFWTALHQLKTLGGMGFAPVTPTTLRMALDTIGVPYDATKLGQVFTDRTSTTWYTIDAQGTVGNAHRHIRAVYQSQEGQYYYYRIE